MHVFFNQKIFSDNIFACVKNIKIIMTDLKNKELETNKNFSLFSLTWPIFIELALHCVTLSLNLFLVGKISVDLVAALTVGNQVFEFSMIIFNFIGIGTTVVIAQNIGAKKYDEIPKVVHMGLLLNIVLGFILALGIYHFADNILNLMNTPSEIYQDGYRYLAVITLALIPEAINFVFISVLRAYSYTKQAMYVSFLVNIVTFIINILVLFGLFGLPKLGVAGVAFSTFIGRIIGTVVLFYVVLYKTKLHLVFKDLFKFNKILLKRMLNVGLPGAGENLSWHVQFMLITSFAATFGDIALATHGLYFQICIFIMMFAQSIAMGTEIIVAHHIGAFKIRQAYNQLIKSLKIGFVVTLAIALGNAFIFGKSLLGLYTDSSEVFKLASNLFLLSIIMEPGRIFNIIVINSLRAVGDAKFPLMMAIISMWGVSVPIAYYLGIHCELGLIGIWIGMACDEWVRGISMFIRWHSRIWERKLVINRKKYFSFG